MECVAHRGEGEIMVEDHLGTDQPTALSSQCLGGCTCMVATVYGSIGNKGKRKHLFVLFSIAKSKFLNGSRLIPWTMVYN